MAQLSRLTKLFVNISDNLIEDDVRNLRALVAIERVLGKARVQNATALEILHMLVDNATICERDMGFLVEVLMSLRKEDLAMEAECLEQEHIMAEIGPQDTDASEPGISGPRGSESDDSPRQFNTPGSGPKGGERAETEVKSVLRPKGASHKPEMLTRDRKFGLTDGGKQIYNRRRPASEPSQKRVAQNVGNAYISKGKRVGYVVILCLFFVEVSRVMEWSERDWGLYYSKKAEFETALKWFRKDLEAHKESGDTANQKTAHIYVADTYRSLGKSDQAKSHFNTALQMAQQTGDQHGQMNVHFRLGEMHMNQLDSPRESIQYYEQYLALAKQLKDMYEEGRAHNRLGQAHHAMGEYEAALEWHQKHMKLSQERKYKEGQVAAHINVGITYMLQDKVDQATSHFNTALQMEQQTGDLHGQMGVYRRMGDIQREQLHSPRTSIQHYEQYLALARQLGDRRQEGLAYNRLGHAHCDMEEYDVALEWHQKHLKVSQEREDKKEQVIANNNLGNAYRLLSKVDEAKSHFNTALQMAQQTGDQHGQMQVYYCMGEMQREQLHSPRKSIQYYEQYLALATQLGDRHEEGVAYNRLGQAHYDMGEYETALGWYKKNLKIRQESGVKTGQMTAHQCIAASYKKLGKTDLARSHFQSAMTIAMETGNKQEQEDIEKRLASI